MREVLSAVIDQLRLEKNIDYLDLEYIPDNIGSAKLQECLGFKTVGTERLDSVELIVCALSFAD